MTAEGVNWLFECWGSERDLLCVGYHGDLPEFRAPGGGTGVNEIIITITHVNINTPLRDSAALGSSLVKAFSFFFFNTPLEHCFLVLTSFLQLMFLRENCFAFDHT